MKRQKMLVIVVSIIYMICSSSTILTNVYLNQLKKTNVVLHSGIVKTYGGLLNAEKFADSYELIINDPSISQNTTYLTISDLNITFTNETEINDASADDNVTLVIYNDEGFLTNYSMSYDINQFHGWGKVIYIFDYDYPGIYYINLMVQTGLYYFNSTIDSFEINFSIHFSNPLLGLNIENQTMHISISITVEPYIYLDYILFNSSIYGCIFNSTNYLVKTIPLNWGGFSFWWYHWTALVNIDDFETDTYYSVGLVVYEDDVFFSPPSNEVFYQSNLSTETPTETNEPTTPESTENTISTLLSVISVLFISCLYFWKRKKVRSRKK